MRAVAPPAGVPRADAPRAARRGGWFPYARTDLRGLGLPFWLLLLWLFVSTSCVDEEWARIAQLRPRLLLGGLAAVVTAVRALRAGFSPTLGPAPRDAPTAWWGAFMFGVLLSTLWAYDTSLAKDAALDLVTPWIGFALLLALVRTRRELLLVVLVFALGQGLFLLRSFQEFHNGRHVATMGVVRMVGAGTRNADPNSFAATVAFSLPLLVWAGVFTRSWLLRFCVICYGLLGVLAVVLTRSRSGLVLIGLTAIWTIAFLPGRRARWAGLAVLLIAGAVAATQISPTAWRRYVGMLSGGSTKSEIESTQGRIEGYRVAWKILQDRPVLGVGPGNWSLYRSHRIDGSRLMPHNLPGQLAATLGLLGVVTFVGYLVATGRRGWRALRAGRGTKDPWARALTGLVQAALFVLLLQLVSGLGAHNLTREGWAWAPALLLIATRPPAAEEDPGRETA